MARYPNAFEKWYVEWLQSQENREHADRLILQMRDDKEVGDLAEGERRLRKMLLVEWMISTDEGREWRKRRTGKLG